MPNPQQKRRSLEDLLNDPDAQAFVRKQSQDTSARQHVNVSARQRVDERISVSVKIPKRLADALWQAMHERTLAYKTKALPQDEPYEKQDIVAQALEQWLKEKGYLKA